MNIASAPPMIPPADLMRGKRAEHFAILILTLVGGLVRFSFPGALAIEHFDEGVYASNLWFPDRGFSYPDRHLYAPPLLPTLIEWSILMFGDSRIVPMLPSLFLGTLSIPLTWWIGRQWFGSNAGLVAAMLLCFSDFHIAFSRSALTDVTLSFFLMLAVSLFERALRWESWPAAVGAGFVTGFAWWAKYNGWLPLAIALSGLAGWWLIGRQDSRQLRSGIGKLAVAGLIAASMFGLSCWFLPNGYAEVSANHSRYFGGLENWWPALCRQAALHHHFDGWLTAIGTGISILLGFVVTCLPWRTDERTTPRTWLRMTVLLSTFGVLGSVLFVRLVSNDLLLLVHSVSCLYAFLFRSNGRVVDRWQELVRNPATWLLAAWWIGLLVATPLYRPYPRLSLPWLLATFLLTGMAIEASKVRCVTFERFLFPTPFVRARQLIGMPILIAMMLICFWSRWPGPVSPTWQSRDGLAVIAQQLRSDALLDSKDSDVNFGSIRLTIYVRAEPGLFFHLPVDSVAVVPVSDLKFLGIEATHRMPTYLATGPHSDRDPEFVAALAEVRDQFELVSTYSYDASDFVRLDDVSPAELRARREPLEIRLYKVKATTEAE